LVDALFTYTRTAAIESAVRVINPASRRVMEKTGFQYVGADMMALPALASRVPVDTFRLDRSTWSSLRSWKMPHIAVDPVSSYRPEEIAACA
jgi:RimJ/RimL family protein N-acetyltransferase